MNLFKQIKSRRLLRQSFRTYQTGEIVNSQNFVDLRSDTVTRPSQKMREAMVNCEVGDDVYKDDPTVNKLQQEIAKLFGKEDSLFLPSGTMSNLIGMMIHVRQKGEGAILGSDSHIYLTERGGISAIGGIHPIIVPNHQDGTIDLEMLKLAIPPQSDHLSQPRLISLESSHNVWNGNVLSLEYINKVKQIANQNNLKMHLDGARALNAAVHLNVEPSEMVKDFDTVNFCLSKGMGCPVGSLIIGNQEQITFARMLRKLLGGQARQVGILASCGLVSLEDWKEKLKEDNDNANFAAKELSKIDQIDVLAQEVQTNIFRFALKPDYKKLDHGTLCDHLKGKYNILINPTFTKDSVRVVTHRDVTRKDLEYLAKSLKDCL